MIWLSICGRKTTRQKSNSLAFEPSSVPDDSVHALKSSLLYLTRSTLVLESRNEEEANFIAYEFDRIRYTLSQDFTQVSYLRGEQRGIRRNSDLHSVFASAIIVLRETPELPLIFEGFNLSRIPTPRDVILIDPRVMHYVRIGARRVTRSFIVLIV